METRTTTLIHRKNRETFDCNTMGARVDKSKYLRHVLFPVESRL